MVDIGAASSTKRSLPRQAGLTRADSAVLVEVRPADDVALADYETFCRNATHAPAQHPLWVRSWIRATGADALIVAVRRDGRPVVQLALEVVKNGPCRIARFMGGSHANGNFIGARGAAALSAADGRALAAAIREARPDIDLVRLERQNPHYDGAPNPLAGLATTRSPNVSLAADLDGGFEALLERAGAKRKKKKYRLQLRRFEEVGGYRLIKPSSPEDVDRLLSAFFVMKAARFKEKGIANVFAADEVQAFFRALFGEAVAEPEPPFLLYGLEVAGELCAVNGLSMTRHSVVCEFGGILAANSRISPGYFLDYSHIEETCAAGKRFFDFSVGDEVYKRSWCDVETWQFDTLLPLTMKGRVAFVYQMARARAVGFVKSSPLLWPLVKSLRAGVAGDKADKPADED